MLLTIVLTPLSAVALLGLAAWMLPLKWVLAFGALTAIGAALTFADRRRKSDGWMLLDGEEPELQGIVDRLCVTADLPRPQLVLDAERPPNSWVVDAPGRPPRLHVTRGLLDLLEPYELEAVVAHELSHVAHRDATVMTVVGLPGAAMLEGARRNNWASWGPLIAGRLLALAIGTVARVGSSALSRHRELTADAGAATLTGRPSALASALLKVSGALQALPTEDLRLVAARDQLHLVAVDEERWPMWKSHPSVAKRVAALERLERRMATARPADPLG
jgi:heat shock protein HtpX